MTPAPPPRGGLARAVAALAALAIAAALGVLTFDVHAYLQRPQRPAADPAGLAEALDKLDARLRDEAELGRAAAAVAAFETLLDAHRFEFEHGLSCVAFLALLSAKPNFDALAADPDRPFARTIYSKAVYEIENVNYATKDVEHPLTKELRNCVAPGAGQERVAFPDELSVIVFKERFDAQIDAVFVSRFQLALATLQGPLLEYSDFANPARRLIDREIGDLICKTAVRRLLQHKTDSEIVRRIASGRAKSVADYAASACGG